MNHDQIFTSIIHFNRPSTCWINSPIFKERYGNFLKASYYSMILLKRSIGIISTIAFTGTCAKRGKQVPEAKGREIFHLLVMKYRA